MKALGIFILIFGLVPQVLAEGYGKSILACETEAADGDQFVVAISEGEQKELYASLIRKEIAAEDAVGSTPIFQYEPVQGGAVLVLNEFERDLSKAYCGFQVGTPGVSLSSEEGEYLYLELTGISPGYPHMNSYILFRNAAFGYTTRQKKRIDCNKLTTFWQLTKLQEKCDNLVNAND